MKRLGRVRRGVHRGLRLGCRGCDCTVSGNSTDKSLSTQIVIQVNVGLLNLGICIEHTLYNGLARGYVGCDGCNLSWRLG